MENGETNYIKVSPDQLGYQDRGKMKWMGMMLSDHTEALKKLHKLDQKLIQTGKEWQSQEKISQILLQAYAKQNPLSIQLNLREGDSFVDDIEGVVRGYKGNYIFVETSSREIKKFPLEYIRHVKYLDPRLWYEKIDY